VKCLTTTADLGENAAIRVKLGNQKYECAATDTTRCAYTQTAGGSFPAITSVAKGSGTTVVFTGTGFYTVGYTASASFMGVAATSVTADSATQATATWALGVPTTTVTDETSATSLAFTLSSGAETTYYAILPADNGGRLQNAFALTTSSTGLSCSFQGGCLYSVSGTEGLASLMEAAPADNYIKVCERKCVFVAASSTAGEAKCLLPSLPTTYSNTQFEIEPVSENLDSGIYFGADSAKLAFDNSIYTVPSETSSTGVIGMQFLPGFVGLISQVKYFIAEIPADRARYVDNVVFEGSLDGVDYTELFRADRNVHEGWNYYQWDTAAEYPQYRFYRFRGLGGLDGPVRINEVVFTGTEVINNSESSYGCVAELVMKGEANVALA